MYYTYLTGLCIHTWKERCLPCIIQSAQSRRKMEINCLNPCNNSFLALCTWLVQYTCQYRQQYIETDPKNITHLMYNLVQNHIITKVYYIKRKLCKQVGVGDVAQLVEHSRNMLGIPRSNPGGVACLHKWSSKQASCTGFDSRYLQIIIFLLRKFQ